MKKLNLIITLIMLCLFIKVPLSAFNWDNPDFGQDGMAGLTDSEKNELKNGRIVFSATDKERDNSMIEATIIFNKPPEEVWDMLSKTEEQIKYLKEVNKIKLIDRNCNTDTMWFQLKIILITLRYQINHHYNKDYMCFYWSLDPSYKSDFRELKGFWKFYPYENNKTVARYGSLVNIKFLPLWLQDAIKKKGVEKALNSVKCYVDSGGTCKRKGY
jgi:ribosome-associated toxin RatA of RatAB toxin-antitoxin module